MHHLPSLSMIVTVEEFTAISSSPMMQLMDAVESPSSKLPCRLMIKGTRRSRENCSRASKAISSSIIPKCSQTVLVLPDGNTSGIAIA